MIRQAFKSFPRCLCAVLLGWLLCCTNNTAKAYSPDCVQIAATTSLPDSSHLISTPYNKRWEDFTEQIICHFKEQLLSKHETAAISLVVLNTAVPDAFILKNGTMVFSSGMLTLIKSTSEYAFLVAHELAHNLLVEDSKLQTPVQPAPGDQYHGELDADFLALRLLKAAGFNPAEGLNLLKRIGKTGSQHGLTLDTLYPSLPLRRKKIQAALKHPHFDVG